MQKRRLGICSLAVPMLLLAAASKGATYVYDVSLITSNLAPGTTGDATAPYYLDLHLLGGYANNTASIYNFSFGGGSVVSPPFYVGNGASGDAASSIILHDSSSIGDSELFQQITPGSALNFRFSVTDNVPDASSASGAHDSFFFTIDESADDGSGDVPSIPSQTSSNPNGAFLSADLVAGGPSIQTFGSDTGSTPVVSAPTFTADIGPTAAYWKGSQSSSWSTINNPGSTNNTNFLDGPTGSDTHQLPGTSTDVYETATGATNLTQTLDSDFVINSLTFTSAETGVTIASGNTLTLNASAGNGITVQSGAGINTINANITLASSQTWTNNSTNPLTVGGVVDDGGGRFQLTTAGTGTIALTNANTYTGGTVISGGTLRANNTTGSATGTGAIDIQSGGKLGGSGTIGNGTNVITVESGGTITAGADDHTTGTLTTGSQVWSSGGTFVAKVNGTAGNDQLVMSGLSASSSFTIALQDLTAGTISPFTASNIVYTNNTQPSGSGSYIVLATVPDASNSGPSTNPFNPSLFTFNSGTVATAAAGDSIELATFDSGTSYELIAEDVASPEPTSALLFGAVVSPLLLGRRRKSAQEYTAP